MYSVCLNIHILTVHKGCQNANKLKQNVLFFFKEIKTAAQGFMSLALAQP